MKYNHRRLGKARRDAGLDLRAAAKLAGLLPRHLRLLEAGVSVPRSDTLARIATAYQKAVDFFFVESAAA